MLSYLYSIKNLLLLFSRQVVSDSLQLHYNLMETCQVSLLFTITGSLLKFISTESVMLSNPLLPPSPLSSVFPRPRAFLSESTLCIRWPDYWSFSFSICPSNYWLVWSPCCPRDSQESSPVPQFKSINSLAVSLHYGSTLTSIAENYNADYIYIPLSAKWWLCYVDLS